MLEQVGQDPVLGDIGFQAGAVDDEVGRDLPNALGGLDHADDHAVVTDLHLLHGAGHRVVPALGPALVHLLLPAPSPRGVRPAHQLVLGGALLALEPAHLRLQLPAPYRLRVVEPLVGKTVAALAAHPGVRSVRGGDIGPEQVHDLEGEVVLGAVVHQALQDPRGNDPATADQYHPGLDTQAVVDVLVVLVGADHVVEVLILGPEGLQFGQELQAWIPDRDVHELGPERDAAGRFRVRRGQDGEIAAALASADHPDLALDQHVRVADPFGLALEPFEHHAGPRRVEVGPHRLDQHL